MTTSHKANRRPRRPKTPTVMLLQDEDTKEWVGYQRKSEELEWHEVARCMPRWQVMREMGL